MGVATKLPQKWVAQSEQLLPSPFLAARFHFAGRIDKLARRDSAGRNDLHSEAARSDGAG